MSLSETDFDITKIKWPEPAELTELDKTIYALAKKYDFLARDLLREIIRIPADHYDQDSFCGTSNHEGPRLEYLKNRIVELGAVSKPEDVFFDEFGSLCWTVTDENDSTPLEEKKCIYLDGHSDTVYPLRQQWQESLGKGIDCYDGLTNPSQVSIDALIRELKHVPSKEKWNDLIFGRGMLINFKVLLHKYLQQKFFWKQKI